MWAEKYGAASNTTWFDKSLKIDHPTLLMSELVLWAIEYDVNVIFIILSSNRTLIRF